MSIDWTTGIDVDCLAGDCTHDHEAEAATPPLDVERLREAMADEAFYIEDDEGNMLPYDEAARRLVARLSRPSDDASLHVGDDS